MYINAGWRWQFYSVNLMSIVFRSCDTPSCKLFAKRWKFTL